MSMLHPSVELLEARIAPATLYVGKSDDFIIITDVGPAGLSPGDTVNLTSGVGSSHGEAVNGLIFGTDAFTSISAAVTAASAEGGDIIRVGPGTFTEKVTIDKPLTLLGNLAGVDARGRIPVAETVLNHIAGSFVVSADNVRVDGFLIEGQRDSHGTAAVSVLNGYSGFQLENSILRGNATALDWNNGTGATSIVQKNVFRDNFHGELGIGRAIISSLGLGLGRLSDNLFAGAHGTETVNLTEGVQSGGFLRVERSEFEDGNNLVLRGIIGAHLVENTFRGVQSGLPFAPEAILILENASGTFVRNTFADHNVTAIRVHASTNGVTSLQGNEITQDLSLYKNDVVAVVEIFGASERASLLGTVVRLSGAQSDSSAFEAAVLLHGANGSEINPIGNEIDMSAVQFDTSGAKQISALKITGVNSPNQLFQLRSNALNGAEIGLHVTGIDQARISALGNDFSGNELLAIRNDTDTAVDARLSWFGTAKKKAVAKTVAGNVDVTGFVATGEDQSATLTGFQSVGVLDLRNPRKAIYTDIDGDRITVTTNKGAFRWENFDFQERGLGLDLVSLNLSLEDDPAFAGASISFTAKKRPTGDGLVAVGAVVASQLDLKALTVNGDLGTVRAGDQNSLTPGLGILRVNSLGFASAYEDAGGSPMVSLITGDLGKLLVKRSVTGVGIRVVGGESAGIGTVKIGGDLIGNQFAGSGTILALGDIGSVSIGGSIVAGDGDLSAAIVSRGKIGSVAIGGSIYGDRETGSGRIVADTTIGKVKIGGTMSDAHIIAGGLMAPSSAAQALAIGSVTVGKDVINSRILAGFDGSTGATFKQSDVQIGSINVRGGWQSSDVSAGVSSTDEYFGNADDTLVAGDGAIISRIASITVGGLIGGTRMPLDSFGFVAEQIGTFKNGGRRLALNAAIDGEIFFLGQSSDVFVREV